MYSLSEIARRYDVDQRDVTTLAASQGWDLRKIGTSYILNDAQVEELHPLLLKVQSSYKTRRRRRVAATS